MATFVPCWELRRDRNEAGLVIEAMRVEDWPQVEAIYREGLATGHATFETDTPTWKEWDQRHLPFARLVARVDAGASPNLAREICGWAALSPVSVRKVYAGVAEVSVYVAERARGQGMGQGLLEALIRESEKNGIWTLQAGIFPENAPSLALHRKCGFREVGRRERIGWLAEAWRDTILLERRSTVVGS